MIWTTPSKSCWTWAFVYKCCRNFTDVFDTPLLREWFLWLFLSLWVACKLFSLTAVQLSVICPFFFVYALLVEFMRVSLFTSVTWERSSALIQGVPNPQAAFKTSNANPSLHRSTWEQICTSICPTVSIYTSIWNMSPSSEYFSKCCCTCLIACQKKSLGKSLSLPK